MPTFELDEVKHIYTLDGVELPGVTTILKTVGIESGFYPAQGRDGYLDRGKKVHKACHLLVTGGGLDWNDLDPRIKGYVRSFERWLSDSGFKVIVSEWRAYCPQWYFAGTVDLVGWLNKQRVIVDIKSGVEITKGTAIQTAGYQILWDKNTPTRPVTERYGLQLKADGSLPKLKQYNNPSDLDVFKAARMVYSWRVRNDNRNNIERAGNKNC